MPPRKPATPRASVPDVPPPLEAGPVAHAGVVVIETATAADLEELLHDPRIAPLLLARLGDCAAVALPQHAQRLLSALSDSGRTPSVEGEA
jgi:hypothetical protein